MNVVDSVGSTLWPDPTIKVPTQQTTWRLFQLKRTSVTGEDQNQHRDKNQRSRNIQADRCVPWGGMAAAQQLGELESELKELVDLIIPFLEPTRNKV